VQTALTGKKLRIRITDAQITFDFEWRNGGFAACRNNAEADLSIAASAHDFLLLARREEDPDTLFFSRRLAMEGDTELGLWVKNTLDAIDLSVFDLTRTGPGQLLSRLKPKPRHP
jgi:predicted lipid carrier protein YhbT